MNWNMLGHEWAVRLLQGHLSHGGARHAYLITGPQGVGRRTLALRFVQAMSCPQPVALGQPCRVCRACEQIERNQHPDLSVVQADRVGGILKVEKIRTLQRSLSLTPYQAPYRVAVLLRFEEANPNAANALLKTLEEPPDQVTLILTAESAEALLPTIVSRCEVLRLRPLSLAAVADGLQTKWEVPPEEAKTLAHISGGRPGYAVYLHKNPEALEARQNWLDEQQRLLRASRVTRFAVAERMAKDKGALREAIQVWVSFWRDVLLCAAGAASPPANLDRLADIETLAARLDLADVRRALGDLEKTLRLLDRNVNTRLATEVLFLDMPRVR